jgi:hypothetical protein
MVSEAWPAFLVGRSKPKLRRFRLLTRSKLALLEDSFEVPFKAFAPDDTTGIPFSSNSKFGGKLPIAA